MNSKTNEQSSKQMKNSSRKIYEQCLSGSFSPYSGSVNTVLKTWFLLT